MIPGPSALGVDIGGTKTVAALVGPDGRTGLEVRVPTPARNGPDAILGAAISAARSVLDGGGAAPAGCGVGTAGTVGPDGVIRSATGTLPGWTGTDVAAAFRDALDLPVTVLNDVHAAATAELWCGTAADAGSALIVWAGTGVGGALITDGVVLTGRTGTAGAIGHLPASRAAGRTCSCGAADHLEAYASGLAIAASYSGPGPALTLPEVAALARSGDIAAVTAIAEAGAVLGEVLGGAASLLDPDVIIIGGGVAELADLLDAPVRASFLASALPGPATARLAFSTLGPLTVVIGAARAALALFPGPQPAP